MTTLTIAIPDEEIAFVSTVIKSKGGHIIANSKENFTKSEQLSLNRSLKEAGLIKAGQLKALTFDELWDE